MRSVQVHDRPVDAAGAGQRVALALVGAERSVAPRGATLATPGALQATYRLECGSMCCRPRPGHFATASV